MLDSRSRKEHQQTEEEMGNHQQRDNISTLQEKIESAYYQVTRIAVNKRPRLTKTTKYV